MANQSNSTLQNKMILPYGVAEERLPLPRHEIMLHLRTNLEATHRERLCRYSMWYPLEPRFDDIDNLSRMDIEQANECCNKTSAFYVCGSKPTSHTLLLVLALHNWLYDKWLRPYRNDIEYGQFVANIIKPKGIPEGTPTRQLIDNIISTHPLVCDKVQETRQSFIDLDHADPNWLRLEERQQPQPYFLLQPLFRAVAIIVDGNDYHDQVVDVGQLTAYVVCPGTDDGLSAPVNLLSVPQITEIIYDEKTGKLKAVGTTVDSAFQFIQALELRERAIFGVKPDPIRADENWRNGYGIYAEELIERGKKLGLKDEELRGPSSRWVDTRIYTEWIGSRANFDIQSRQWEAIHRGRGKAHREEREAIARGEPDNQSRVTYIRYPTPGERRVRIED